MIETGSRRRLLEQRPRNRAWPPAPCTLIRSRAIWQYSSFSSIRIKSRPCRSATSSVVPAPPKGSRTVPPCGQLARTHNSIRSGGKDQNWTKTRRALSKLLNSVGAGEGNRTLVVSLGSFCSAIELHPRSPGDDKRSAARLQAPFALRRLRVQARFAGGRTAPCPYSPAGRLPGSRHRPRCGSRCASCRRG